MPARLFRSAKADRNRFIVLYVSMTLGLLIAAGLFVYEARIIVADGLRDEEAFAVLGVANRVLHDLENAETGQRGYLLTGDESYLVPYREGIRDLDDTVLRLQQAAGSDERSLELVRRVEHAKTDKVTELARTIELARSGNRTAAVALVQTNEGKLYMDGLRQDLSLLLNDWRERRRVATEDAHQRLVFGSAALVAIAVLVCCLMVYTVYIQRRAFARVHAYSNALNQQAAQDTLTGLPNRRRLLSAIDALSDDEAASRRIALLYLDIDGFKNVNDAMGHSAGDVLLRRLAESLRTATRQNDMLARVGGDEFVLLATDCGDDSRLRELADRLVSSVRAVGDKEYGGRFAIGVSIGIATFPDRVQTVAGLLDVADAAMYVAKRSGRSTYSFGSSPGPGLSNVVKLTR
ncbi:diguanylate cyclase domain-containing protein [Paraburkholderia kirstenboschensis]|uniref:Diguanylate cyclase n=1 Tax=Paraburkholderia kirstenboschensis TaxID=1245436 RepID=A0ABZ0EIV9_9BURK|nr:diguanylate cyclase [Paraburkholderia kirstenboschensis]WOD17173.1 diguanylate cyclase [Paraburkholderia kirstenboschensis]